MPATAQSESSGPKLWVCKQEQQQCQYRPRRAPTTLSIRLLTTRYWTHRHAKGALALALPCQRQLSFWSSIKDPSEVGRAAADTCLYLVDYHGLIGKVDYWLGHSQSERPQPCAVATNKNERLHAASQPCYRVSTPSNDSAPQASSRAGNQLTPVPGGTSPFCRHLAAACWPTLLQHHGLAHKAASDTCNPMLAARRT